MNTDMAINTGVVAEVASEERAAFIKRTYTHLALAILAFIGLEFAIFATPWAEKMTATMLGTRYAWLIVLGAFMAVSWIADKWAESSTSRPMQYAGLGLYVVAEAIIFVPLLYIAGNVASPEVIPVAALLTGLLFLGLTLVAFTSQKDFSFLGGILKVGGCVALGVIVAAIMFGFSLGLLFSSVMVAFAAGSILYTTSKIIHNYNPDQYVAASLSLFAGVALMFWYVIRILISLTGRD
jgi:hypothetical protein